VLAVEALAGAGACDLAAGPAASAADPFEAVEPVDPVEPVDLGGRADGRSDGRFAGGRDEAEEPAAFFAVFCVATFRAGGADERRPVVGLVALT
jgi:hypothetical protein